MNLNIILILINFIFLLPFLKSFFYFFLFDYFFTFYLNLDFFYFSIWWNTNFNWFLNLLIFCFFIVYFLWIIHNHFKIINVLHYKSKIIFILILAKFLVLFNFFFILFL